MPPAKKAPAKSLAETVLDTPAAEPAKTEEHDNSGALTPEQLEIETLKAELAKARAAQERNHPVDSLGRPLSDEELTPEQREIRALQDQLARQKGKGDVVQEVFEDVDAGDGILVHFLEDGVTSNGRTFYRGQEVTFGKVAFEDTKDRFGNSWLDMSDAEQFDRWGAIKFRKGPWPGKRVYEEPEAKSASIRSQVPATRI